MNYILTCFELFAVHHTGVSILKCVAIVVSFFATLRSATADEGHIWTIALGHDWGAYEYVLVCLYIK